MDTPGDEFLTKLKKIYLNSREISPSYCEEHMCINRYGTSCTFLLEGVDGALISLIVIINGKKKMLQRLTV